MALQVGLLGGLLGLGIAKAKPDLLPQIGSALRPVTKALLHSGLTFLDTIQELAAEGKEHLSDLVAEVQYERSVHPEDENEQKTKAA